MTLDQLIEKAIKLRETHGGDLLVGAWPYDGQMLWERYLTDSDLVLYEDTKVITGRHGVGFSSERRTFLMVEEAS